MWVRQAMEHHNPILKFIHGKQLFKGKIQKNVFNSHFVAYFITTYWFNNNCQTAAVHENKTI